MNTQQQQDLARILNGLRKCWKPSRGQYLLNQESAFDFLAEYGDSIESLFGALQADNATLRADRDAVLNAFNNTVNGVCFTHSLEVEQERDRLREALAYLLDDCDKEIVQGILTQKYESRNRAKHLLTAPAQATAGEVSE